MFILPVTDEKPAHFPVVTYGLILINLLIHSYLVLTDQLDAAIWSLGFVPATHDFVRAFMGMFLHANWEHVIGNMYFLYIFGRRVEDRVGSVWYLLVYLICGFASALVFWLSGPGSLLPCIGASGAIAGVMGLCMMLRPWDKMSLQVFVTLIPVLKIPFRSIFMCGLWFMFQWWETSSGDTGGVAVWGHVGGFLCGVLASIFAPHLKPKAATLPPSNT